MESLNNILKSEVVYIEETHEWLTCGHILAHIDNFNFKYIIECTICKVRFNDNDLFLKHLRDNHTNILTQELRLKEECEETYCKSPVFEYNLSNNEFDFKTGDNKELHLNEQCLDGFKQEEFKNLKNENSDSNEEVSLTSDEEETNIKNVEESKSDKQKILEKQGIPYTLCIPENGFFQCSECHSKFKNFLGARNHFWLKHTYHLKLDNEECVPDIPENCRNPEDQLFHCTACLGRYVNFEKLLEHFKRHPGAKMIKKKPHKCSYCDKTCWTIFSLKTHEVTHNRERPFKCEICTKAFMRKNDVVKHSRIHTNNRKLKCNFCDKMFFNESSRKQHEAYHLDLKTHICDVCGKEFVSKARLTDHLRRHNGVKRAVCNICHKAFFDNKTLRDHMPVHTGEKTFECKTCQRTFSRKKNLINHEKLHSDVRNYICEICNQGFKQRSGLYSHLKCFHNKMS